MGPSQHLRSAPSRTRTDTWRILSPLPLPIGLWGRGGSDYRLVRLYRNSGGHTLECSLATGWQTLRSGGRYFHSGPLWSDCTAIGELLADGTEVTGWHGAGHGRGSGGDCRDRVRRTIIGHSTGCAVDPLAGGKPGPDIQRLATPTRPPLPECNLRSPGCRAGHLTGVDRSAGWRTTLSHWRGHPARAEQKAPTMIRGRPSLLLRATSVSARPRPYPAANAGGRRRSRARCRSPSR